tara:strand:- start:1098 stop:1535 length:438 start_codon:yes stop_codon:yes gene_type:complete
METLIPKKIGIEDDYDIEPSKYCDICCEKHDHTTVRLKCNHRFHYACIFESYKTESKTCPYCRSDSGSLPVPESCKPIKKIHDEYKKYKLKKYTNNLSINDEVIVKKGKYKGRTGKIYKVTDSRYYLESGYQNKFYISKSNVSSL